VAFASNGPKIYIFDENSENRRTFVLFGEKVGTLMDLYIKKKTVFFFCSTKKKKKKKNRRLIVSQLFHYFQLQAAPPFLPFLSQIFREPKISSRNRQEMTHLPIGEVIH
jgi:hypothetical protein